MKNKTLILIATAVFLSGCITTKQPESSDPNDIAKKSAHEIQQNISGKHPVNYIILATKLLKEGQADEAVKWYYIGQIRYRAHLMANPDLDKSGDPALYGSLKQVVGKPINEYAGQNPDHWLELIDAAMEWHKGHPNNFTPKASHPKIYQEIERGFAEFRSYIFNNKDEIRKKRARNGLKSN